jgi:hypothetical protein
MKKRKKKKKFITHQMKEKIYLIKRENIKNTIIIKKKIII